MDYCVGVLIKSKNIHILFHDENDISNSGAPAPDRSYKIDLVSTAAFDISRGLAHLSTVSNAGRLIF
jgi:hypothetical protein